MKKLRNLVNYIRRYGLRLALRESSLRLSDAWYDNYFGVKTGIKKDDIKIGMQDKEAIDYCAIHYKLLFSLFDQQPDLKSETTLLDYGCGKGRVMVVAAFSNFKKIIGIEYSSMVAEAQNNLKKMKHRKTKDIEIMEKDARHYIIPPDVNLIYFYNPFIGSVLQTVIDNIQLSCTNHPRKIKIIYVNNDHFDRHIAGQKWITKKVQGSIFPENSYGLYETV